MFGSFFKRQIAARLMPGVVDKYIDNSRAKEAANSWAIVNCGIPLFNSDGSENTESFRWDTQLAVGDGLYIWVNYYGIKPPEMSATQWHDTRRIQKDVKFKL